MNNYSDSTLNHILKNKQIILSTIILGLAAIFIFSIGDRRTPAKASSPAEQKEEFVIKAQENEIQPTDLPMEDYAHSETVIYEQGAGEPAKCDGQEDGVPVISGGDDVASRKVHVPILMYHYIDAPGSSTLPWLYHSPAIFEAQLKTLANNCYNSVFVSEVAKAIEDGEGLKPKSFAITFDDGYEDMYTKAYPLLKKYGMKGTMYIIVNALDTPGYLTREQVLEMSDSGTVEIASHTLNHVNLKAVTWEKARYELAASKKALEEIIGKSVTDFAYPYGFFNLRDEEICRLAGYSSCASTYPGQVQTWAKRFSLVRLRPGYRVGPALINWLELAGPKI